MKKRVLSGMIIAGAAVLSAGLAGCAGQETKEAAVTKDSLLDKSIETFAKMKSLDADISIDMDMSLGGSGFSMDVKNKLDMNAEGVKDGVTHMKGTMEMTALGQDQSIELEGYTENEGNQLVQYSKLSQAGSEGSWTVNKVDTSSVESPSEMSVSQIGNAYTKLKDGLSELKLSEGTVSYNSTDCYLVSGTITGEKLVEFMKAYGQETPESTVENLELMDVDTQLYFRASDETPYAIEMDMAEAMKKIFAAQQGLPEGMEVNANVMKMVMIFNSIDKVTEVKIPDEVKQNAVESVDAIDVQNMLMGGTM